jgi:hypothetical protein
MAAKKSAGAAGRVNWFDDKSETPLIDQYAKGLESFLTTMADGKVDDKEVRQQEARLVKVMKEVESLLSDEQHAKVTTLLAELAAYTVMEILHDMTRAKLERAIK